jgi:2-succinyl-5-enolpyruvyl-6-hydroxy-3-cyclohexene-1-carboxylate synthase
LLPAAIEAHHGRVPLLLATADRPWESMDVRAAQTIEQTRLFDGLTRFAAAPGVPDLISAKAWRPLAARSVIDAQHHPLGPGPVHLNLAFREPLLPDRPDAPRSGRADGAPWHRFDASPAGLTPLSLRGERGLIVAGSGAPAAGSLHQLGWPVLADPRSGARVPHRLTVAAADALLRIPAVAERLRPDVVVHFGEPWASRVLNEWFAGGNAEHVVVDPYGNWPDPHRLAARVVRGPVALVAEDAPMEGWVETWTGAEAAAQKAIEATLAKKAQQPSASAVVRGLLASAADNEILFVASSMPIRDLEWFGAPRVGARVLSNRGANGIDGLVSTAAGIAWAQPDAPVTAVLGDLAFLHDVGGLRAAAGLANLDYVVIDNDGGAIFDFLPQAAELDKTVFRDLFTAPHGLDLDALAASVPGVRVGVHRVKRGSAVATHKAIHRAVATALGIKSS